MMSNFIIFAGTTQKKQLWKEKTKPGINLAPTFPTCLVMWSFLPNTSFSYKEEFRALHLDKFCSQIYTNLPKLFDSIYVMNIIRNKTLVKVSNSDLYYKSYSCSNCLTILPFKHLILILEWFSIMFWIRMWQK